MPEKLHVTTEHLLKELDIALEKAKTEAKTQITKHPCIAITFRSRTVYHIKRKIYDVINSNKEVPLEFAEEAIFTTG